MKSAKPARERLSDADLRAFTQYHSPQAQAAAREALALRRALRDVKADLNHIQRDYENGLYDIGSFGIRHARAVIARALASPLAATKGGR